MLTICVGLIEGMTSYSFGLGGVDGFGGSGGHLEFPAMLFNHINDVLVLLILGAGIIMNCWFLLDPFVGSCPFGVLFGSRMTGAFTIFLWLGYGGS